MGKKLSGIGTQNFPSSAGKGIEKGGKITGSPGGSVAGLRTSGSPFTATKDNRPMSGDMEKGSTRPKAKGK